MGYVKKRSKSRGNLRNTNISAILTQVLHNSIQIRNYLRVVKVAKIEKLTQATLRGIRVTLNIRKTMQQKLGLYLL